MRISYNFNKSNPVVKAEDGTTTRKFSPAVRQRLQSMLTSNDDGYQDTQLNDNTFVHGMPALNTETGEVKHVSPSVTSTPQTEADMARGKLSREIFAQEHPYLNAAGTVAEALPFVVAATPVMDAAAATTAGTAITNGLTWFNPYLDALTTSYFTAHGVNDIAHGKIRPETVLELMPGYKLIKPVTYGIQKGVEMASEWRPFIPYNPNRYYRIVGETGNPIGDAVESGVIRGPGMNPNLNVTEINPGLMFSMESTPKYFDYPMFAKGHPWRGSTSRAASDLSKKPIVIRSKKNTGPIVWEESNKDFRHKGHAGIFRPSYYGDVNASPTQFFEYYEPKRFGYMRRDFPQSTNPWSHFLGNGYYNDRGAWKSSLGVSGKRFGKYVGSGSE